MDSTTTTVRLTTLLGLGFLGLCLASSGCPDDPDGEDDDDSSTDDDDDDPCDPLQAGAVDAWDGAAALEVGAVAELSGDGGSFSFELTEPGDYLAILISRSLETDTAWDLDVNGGGDRTERAGRGGEPQGRAPGEIDPSTIGADGSGERLIGDPTVPEVGDVRSFEVGTAMGYTTVDAEVIAVSDELVVYEDLDTEYTLDPLDHDFVQEVIEEFEAVVLPRERFFFHQESDVNGDGHVSLLFSYTVNNYGAMAYVSSCDLLPTDDCSHSNQQELIYVSIPDPDDHYSTVSGYCELWAHEFNHNIYFASRFLDNGATDVDENVYATEGTSALAQDLTGFNNGNLYVYGAALEESYDASLTDVFVWDGTHYYSDRDGVMRGAAYLAYRYLYDRYGAEVADDDGTFEWTCGVEFLNDWFTTPTPGFDGIEEVTGLDPVTYITDFWTAIGVHQLVDAGTAADPAYHFQPPTTDALTEAQRGVEFFMTVHGWYDIAGPFIEDLTAPATTEIRSGGATFLQAYGLTEATSFTLETSADAEAVLRVVRVQ